MVIRTLGDVLPIALAIGTSPIPLVAVVLVLGSRRAVANGVAFAIGWILGLVLVAGVLTAIVDVADEESTSGRSTVGGVITVVLGLVFWVLAVRAWRGRPTSDDAAELPGWMATLDTVEPRRAVLVGLGLSGANPKNLALVLAGVTAIATSGLTTVETIVAVAVFVVIGSVGVLGLVGYRVALGPRADTALARVQSFLVSNHHVIVLVLFGFLGAKFVGDGLGALLTT